MENLSFDQVFSEKMRNSIIGQFMDNDVNVPKRDVRESMMDILEHDLMSFSTKEWETLIRRNNFIDDPRKIVMEGISTNAKIDRKFIQSKIVTLRLLVSGITHINPSLKKFIRLKNLNLGGNKIEDIRGEILPRNLEMLELVENRIFQIRNLLHDPPKGLVYLGLSKNQISDETELQSLARSLPFLKALDLEDNNLSNLIDTLEVLKELARNLRSLNLEGNPCSTCYGYKSLVVSTFTRLLYLDNVTLEPEKKPNESFIVGNERLMNGSLVMFIHRIMNLEEPSDLKKSRYVYFFEVDVPLLSEFCEDDELSYNPKPFKTMEFEWNQFLSSHKSILEILPPGNSLERLRDTFKSIVTVRFIQKKLSHNDKLTKRKSKGQRTSSSQPITILSEFTCALRNMSWHHPTQDFEWSPEMDGEALACHPLSLASIKYESSSSSGKIRREKSIKSLKIENADSVVDAPLPLPNILTIQLGFGLRRCPEIKISKITDVPEAKIC